MWTVGSDQRLRRQAMPSIPGLRESKPFTHIEALELDHVPEQLLILGGGYVGLEFAQAFRRFGSRVTVIEGNARLLEGEDDDIAHAVTAVLTGEGIEVVNNVGFKALVHLGVAFRSELNAGGVQTDAVGVGCASCDNEEMRSF